MAFVEGTFDQGRRDLITFGFSRRRDGGRRQPPRGPQPNTTQESPDWNPLNYPISRRNLVIGSVTAGGIFAGAFFLKPWKWINQENPYMSKEAQQLGKEINSWKLKNGISMVAAFPQIKQAADLLEGRIDPRVFLPQLAVPVDFQGNSDNASFSFRPEFDVDSTRKIRVKGNQGEEYTLPFVRDNSYGGLLFPSDLLSSSIRLPIAAKEASQIAENLEYCRVYVSLLKEQGSVSLENPDNIETTEEEYIVSIAYAQAHAQLEKIGSSWLYDFIDIGSHIRVGGIAFANWFKEQLRSGIKLQGDFVKAGHNIAGFLQTKDYIIERNDMFEWTYGSAPEIGSKEFMQLFNEFTGRN